MTHNTFAHDPITPPYEVVSLQMCVNRLLSDPICTGGRGEIFKCNPLYGILPMWQKCYVLSHMFKERQINGCFFL